MKLQLMTWPEVDAYLATSRGIIVPVGSTEQHGPMGLIGTDALCAEAIGERAAELAGAVVAPTLSYTPAPFNTAFPGTISIPEELFEAMASEIVQGLAAQGFARIYVLNAHGANLAPLKRVAERSAAPGLKIGSWWDFEPVNVLRRTYYGDWEGMHATPSEVAITQATHRIVDVAEAAKAPPRALSADYVRAHAGDRHGPPDEHRAAFPDGRVGSHSALATPEHGRALLEAAAAAVAADYLAFARGST
jgi:creatinine amidohydrolase